MCLRLHVCAVFVCSRHVHEFNMTASSMRIRTHSQTSSQEPPRLRHHCPGEGALTSNDVPLGRHTISTCHACAGIAVGVLVGGGARLGRLSALELDLPPVLALIVLVALVVLAVLAVLTSSPPALSSATGRGCTVGLVVRLVYCFANGTRTTCSDFDGGCYSRWHFLFKRRSVMHAQSIQVISIIAMDTIMKGGMVP